MSFLDELWDIISGDTNQSIIAEDDFVPWWLTDTSSSSNSLIPWGLDIFPTLGGGNAPITSPNESNWLTSLLNTITGGATSLLKWLGGDLGKLLGIIGTGVASFAGKPDQTRATGTNVPILLPQQELAYKIIQETLLPFYTSKMVAPLTPAADALYDRLTQMPLYDFLMSPHNIDQWLEYGRQALQFTPEDAAIIRRELRPPPTVSREAIDRAILARQLEEQRKLKEAQAGFAAKAPSIATMARQAGADTAQKLFQLAQTPYERQYEAADRLAQTTNVLRGFPYGSATRGTNESSKSTLETLLPFLTTIMTL